MLPKLYSFLTWSSLDNVIHTSKKAKGVKKKVVDRGISFDDYKQVLKTNKAKSIVQSSICSRNLDLYTIEKKNCCIWRRQ